MFHVKHLYVFAGMQEKGASCIPHRMRPGGPCLSRLHPTRFSCPYASLSEAYYMVSRTLQHFPWRRHVWGKEAIGNHG